MTLPSASLAGAAGRRLGRGCRSASLACLVALAPVMVVAHRSSVLALTLAAAFAVAAKLLDGGGAALRAVVARSLAGPLGLACVAFLAWALLSAGWSASPALSVQALGEFTLPLVAALVLAAALPAVDRRHAALALGASLLLASAMVLADLASGLALRRATGLRPDSFVLNRPALVLVVLLPPAICLLLRQRAIGAALLVAALVSMAALRSDSGAARLGLAAMAAAAAVTALSDRAALALAGAGLALALALAPVMGDLAERWLPDRAHQALAGSHARDRVDIWLSYGAALREAPMAGQGFGASAKLGGAPVAGRVAPEHAAYLAVGHPHAAPLQLWVELGAVGAALAGAVAWLLVRALAGLSRAARLAAIPLLAAVVAVSLVGHGAWQGWWPAAIGAAVVWLRLAAAGESADDSA